MKTTLGLLLCLPASLLVGASDAGGVLSRLSITGFGGSGQTSIQAMTTDADGNVYVAGTTSSPDFPVKNAAQATPANATLLVTTDLGATWKPIPAPADLRLIAPDPVAAGVIFASSAAGIYKTTDGGQTWSLVYPFPATNSGGFTGGLVIDPANHLRIAAVTPAGALVRSLDGGQTWTRAPRRAGMAAREYSNCWRIRRGPGRSCSSLSQCRSRVIGASRFSH